jgi:hypothetical protein
MAQKSSNVQAFSVREFFERFSTEGACLEHLMETRYGLRHPCDKCLRMATFHRITSRPAYSCAFCGHYVYPCAGTIFQDTRTPLRMWFYAIYLFVTTRHGVSGKELQRQLGVTYKTAYRIGQQIRTLMESADIQGLLTGHVPFGWQARARCRRQDHRYGHEGARRQARGQSDPERADGHAARCGA